MNFIKKSVAFACVAMLGLGLFSCKKEYTCTCAYEDGSGEISYTFEAKKSDAEAACGSYEVSVGGNTYACDLK